AFQLKAIRPQALPNDNPTTAINSSNIAIRSLERAHRLQLNSAQEVARQVLPQLQDRGRPTFLPLAPGEILDGESAEVRAILSDSGGGAHASLIENTPLW